MPLRNTDTVIFVYNADSGLFNLVSDMAHKLISPDTYDCQLCMLTHGHLGMRDQWREYLDSLGVEMEFLHRNEFTKKYPDTVMELPALFLARDSDVELLVSADTISNCETMDILIEKINDCIKNIPA